MNRYMGRWLRAGKSFWDCWGDVTGACLLAALAFYFLSGRFTSVRFDRERIEVEVTPGVIHVQGLYHYQNDSRLPAVLTLTTPFPVDQDHPVPDTYTLAEVDGDRHIVRDLELRGRQEAPSVRLLLLAREAKWIQLDYWQTTRSHEGRYLLTTTRPWHRPIASATFRLVLPSDCILNMSNYPLIEIPGAHRSTVLTFSRTNFFPDQDWRFSWQQRQSAAAHGAGGFR
jgi:hypothetical protein